MTDWSNRPPWQYALAGALAVIVLLGFTGHLVSVGPVDRLLNPDARNYWESESDYLRSIYEDCQDRSTAFLGPTGSGNSDRAFQVFKRCYDFRLDDAMERRWVTEKGLREFDPAAEP